MADAPYSAKRQESNAAAIALSKLMALTNNNENVRIAIADILALITKQSLGLQNVDNTADIDKGISTATALALQALADAIDGIGNGLTQINDAQYITIDGQTVETRVIVDLLVQFHNNNLENVLQTIANNLVAPELQCHIALSGIKSDLTDLGIGASYVNRKNITVTGVYLDVATASNSGDDLSVMMKINGVNAFVTPIHVISGSLSQTSNWLFPNEMPNKSIAAGDRVEFDILTAGNGIRGAVITLTYKSQDSYEVPAIGQMSA